jgi:hypothetical protein
VVQNHDIQEYTISPKRFVGMLIHHLFLFCANYPICPHMLEFLLKVSYSHAYVFTQAIEVGHVMPWGKIIFFS